MELRDYQKEAIRKLLWAKDLPGNDVVVLPQGSGKSIVISELAHQLKAPILVLCPNKEILEQNIEKMERHLSKDEIGVFSASVNKKEIKKVTFATVQSVYRHPEKFRGFNMCIIDECDLVNVKKADTMYRKLLEKADIKKVFGFTGTPYRQDVKYERWGELQWQVYSITVTKMINRYRGFFWKRFLTVINTDDLLKKGYLCPIEYYDMTLFKHNQLPLNKSKSDFDLDEVDEQLKSKNEYLAEFIEGLEHRSKLVFCGTIQQAEKLSELVSDSIVVTSKTSKKNRQKAVKDLKEGRISTVFNVGIFTVGFDYPELEAIVLLRPTRSLRLHSQILGRVSRIAEGKEVAHVYDFVDNVNSLGELANIRIVKYNGKWNVISDSFPEGFHNEELYRYKLKEN